jgi:hypothetical protein
MKVKPELVSIGIPKFAGAPGCENLTFIHCVYRAVVQQEYQSMAC